MQYHPHSRLVLYSSKPLRLLFSFCNFAEIVSLGHQNILIKKFLQNLAYGSIRSTMQFLQEEGVKNPKIEPHGLRMSSK